MVNLGIIGLGLMGGSIALSLKKFRPAFRLCGYDINRNHLDYCLNKGMIDEELNYENSPLMDIIFITTPVTVVLKVIKEYYPYIKNTEVLITDMGSTKFYICDQIKKNFPEINFIGGHPMTGREFSGPEAAVSDLFIDKNYILMNNQGSITSKKANLLEEVIKSIGSRIKYFAPEEHDQLVSFTSHLPQFLATAAINELISFEKEKPGVEVLIGQGFLDFTRIAASDSTMWTDIFLTNSENIIQRVDEFINRLNEFKKAIITENQMKIYKTIQQGKDRRLLLNRKIGEGN